MTKTIPEMTMTKTSLYVGHALAYAALLLAVGCSGGGSNPPTPAPTPTPTPTPTRTPVSVAVTGAVVAIPLGSYGTSAPQTPLSGATVVVGNTLIVGPTVPPSLPGSDVAAKTDASGHFSAKVGAPIAPPSGPSLYTFVLPNTNVFNFTPPKSGYFVMVFPSGADGESVGVQLPAHTFAAVTNGSLGTFRSTVASSDEAGWLNQANLDRAAKGQTAVYFDEYVQEAAREHADQLVSETSLCDYSPTNQGPQTRYDFLGGLGANRSNIAILGTVSATDATAFWQAVETAFVGEENIPPPNNYHYAALMFPSNVWMGVAVSSAPWSPGGPNGTFYGADQDNINLITGAAYQIVSVTDCPTGITINGS
jgi:hypothetical protein